MDEESPIASISPTTGAGEETYKSGEQEELSLLASISPIAGVVEETPKMGEREELDLIDDVVKKSPTAADIVEVSKAGALEDKILQ